MPIWTAPNVHIRDMWRGGIVLENPVFNSIHIGYHVADGIDYIGSHTIVNIQGGGVLRIKRDAHIGRGAVICVNPGAALNIGHNFAISGTTSIVCSKEICIGNDVQLSWNSLVMDSDAHKIFDEDGSWINPPKEIVIGNKVWIAAGTTILKGSVIADNTVVASNSLVNKEFSESHTIIGGQPARFLKHIGGFEI